MQKSMVHPTFYRTIKIGGLSICYRVVGPVQDHFLTILTNGKVTTDGVGPHGDLLADFPYLGPPHAAARFATPQ